MSSAIPKANATSRRISVGGGGNNNHNLNKKDATARKMEAMEAQRLERRRMMEQRKLQRHEENLRNVAMGNPGDVDFIGLVKQWRQQHMTESLPLVSNPSLRICVAVRKRPLSDKERNKCDHDSVTVYHPKVWIHAAKYKVDGITKYLDHTPFQFDYAFDEQSETLDVYQYTTLPLLRFVCTGGRATVFCYGQTGSGKTYTMQGIQQFLAEDLFALLQNQNVIVSLSLYELYGGYLQDLLNNRQRLKVLEDGKGEINVTGLTEREACNVETLLQILDEGNSARTTHVTQANDASSRSHAICQILLRSSTGTGKQQKQKLLGKLALVDLAGSERGNDTTSHNAQRRAESADINTSLLALKECIRALGESSKHIPYRGSKLTLILKDCFATADARTAMIATVSPGASSADHSINTLRYAYRIKERHLRTNGSTTIIAASNNNSPKRSPPNRQIEPTPKSTTSPVRPVDLIHTHSQHRPSTQRQSGQPPSRKSDSTTASKSTPSSKDEFSPTADADNDLVALLEDSSDSDNIDPNQNDDDDWLLDDLRRSGDPEDDRDKDIGCGNSNSDDDNNELDELLLQQEDDLLTLHMNNIQEHANLLTEERGMLDDVQRPDVTLDEIHEYALTLGAILERKKEMISEMRQRMAALENSLRQSRRATDNSIV